MVEVFKTTVQDHATASILVHEIQKRIISAKVNFDLEDCDRILRVEVSQNHFNWDVIIEVIQGAGYKAELLSEKIYF